MKKFIIFVLIILPFSVMASSGTIKVTGPTQVVSGNTVTFTVTLASSVDIGSWEMNLNYDKGYLSLQSTNSEAGGTKMVNSSAGIKSKSYTFKFKTLKTGSTEVKIDRYLVYDNNMSEMQISTSGRKLKIITLDELIASYSKDNYLKDLRVGGFEIFPEFDKDILEYTTVVPEDTKSINITAIVNDNNSVVDGEGDIEVTPGNNKFNITVKAQNGDERVYILNVDVKDNNPIEVDYNNQKYTVVKIKENLPTLNSYEETYIKINEFEIPSLINKTINYTLVGLKDEFGKIKLFKYDEGKYTEYIEIDSGNLIVIPSKITKKINGYKKSQLVLNDGKIDCLTINEKSRFKLINGLDVYTNEYDYYLYDTKSQNLITFDDELFNTLNDKSKTFLITTLIFMGTTVLSLVCLICLKAKSKRKSKTKKEKKDEVFDIFESDKKK